MTQLKSIAFLGLLSHQEGFEGKFCSFVWKHQLYQKFLALFETSSDLRMLTEVNSSFTNQSLWMLGSIL